MKHIIALLVIGLLVSCASNTGVYRVGENTYQVTTRATWELGGRVGAMRMAMQEATKFCSEHGGRQLKVIKEIGRLRPFPRRHRQSDVQL
jgi:hypothetical protein